jgi:hypothetical protein
METQTAEDTVQLVFNCPETDFNGIQTEVALKWLEDKVTTAPYGGIDPGLMCAYRVLFTVHNRYMDAIGHPEWKRPNVI